MTNRFNTSLSKFVRVLEWHRLGQFLPWFVLAASLTLTYKLWEHEQQQNLQQLQAIFDSHTRETASNVVERAIAYEQVLLGAQGLFAASESVTRDKFYSYVSSLHLDQNFPGIQGLGFSLIVPHAQKSGHIAAIRSEGLSGYTIQPEGEREVYTPSVYVEPLSEPNMRSLGLDSYADPQRRAAMDMARDTNNAAITGKLLLVETDGHVRAGFVMYLPVYKSGVPHDTLASRRANLVGWVFASSRMEAMMEGIRGEAFSDLDIEIHDGDSISDETLMYDSDVSNSHLASGSNATFRAAIRMAIAGHDWTLAGHSLPGFEFQLDGGKPKVIAYAGIGASVLLALLTGLLVYGRARALQDAREITQSEARYRQMFEENASVAYLLDPDTGHIMDANAAALAFWGYSLEELRSMNIAKISITPSGKIVEVMSKIKSGTTHRMEMLHRTKSGEIRDVEVFSGPLNVDGKTLRYSIAHDITARKRAEEAQRLSSTVFNTVEDAVMVTDPDNLIIMVNPAFTAITGYSAADVIGKNPRILASGKHTPEFFRILWDRLIGSGSWHGEIIDRNKDGEIYTKWLSIKQVQDDSGKLTHYVAVFSDIGAIRSSSK